MQAKSNNFLLSGNINKDSAKFLKKIIAAANDSIPENLLKVAINIHFGGVQLLKLTVTLNRIHSIPSKLSLPQIIELHTEKLT